MHMPGLHMPGLRNPTEREQAIMQLAGDLAARFSERVDQNDPQSLFPLENYRELHEAGYLRLALPKQVGGDGADVFDMVLAQEILARGDASTALVTGMHFAFARPRDRTARRGRTTCWPTSAPRWRAMAAPSTTASPKPNSAASPAAACPA